MVSKTSVRHQQSLLMHLISAHLNDSAAYPSKPSDLQIWFIEGETTVPPLISDEIMGAVKSLESGRMMIVRLCQSISKIMRDSDGS